jgi:hypothetical protein
MAGTTVARATISNEFGVTWLTPAPKIDLVLDVDEGSTAPELSGTE